VRNEGQPQDAGRRRRPPTGRAVLAGCNNFAMLQINEPQAYAELTRAFEAYEKALVDNDIEGLNRLFWESDLTLRYGVKELLYSHAEITRFRRERGPVDQRRVLRNTRIVTFGRDFGVANTEYVPHGTDRVGRQSQTWVRTEQGWKIVAAHVSFLAG
jgi:hypothetical protein